jgi:hypothetical protein
MRQISPRNLSYPLSIRIPTTPESSQLVLKKNLLRLCPTLSFLFGVLAQGKT